MSTQPAPSNVVAFNYGVDDYIVMAPDGKILKISRQLFEALAMFLGGDRQHEAGQTEIQFRNGGVAGVEVKLKLK